MSIRRVAVLAVLLLGCASNPAPYGTLLAPEAVQDTAFGGYILVTRRDGRQTRGELLAAAEGAVHVLVDKRVERIPIGEIASMRLAVYETAEGYFSLWGIGGTLSTLTHGFALIISAPIWIVGSSITTAVESRRALVDYPGNPLPAFARFARYPQGMPARPETKPEMPETAAPPLDASPPSWPRPSVLPHRIE
jgi:hypothetical protein